MATLDLSRDIGRLRSELAELRRDITGYSRHAGNSGRERRDELLERAERFGSRAREQMTRAEERLGETVGERPLVALLAAIGIGFLIAKLLEMRPDR